MAGIPRFDPVVDIGPADNRATVLVCRDCGCLTLDTTAPVHIDWHRAQDEASG
jgi:hypothetical protein